MQEPIIIGGNGHSGTRIFAQILMHNGVFMGVPKISRTWKANDLKVIDLMNKWLPSYLRQELSKEDRGKMTKEFKRRLLWCFPFRSRPWGFKNPRAMLLLPFFHELFPGMKFIHVIRDGRDISLGNNFVYGKKWNAIRNSVFLSKEEERNLIPEETMMLFWGRSNMRFRDYAVKNLKDRYLMMRFEDLCNNPREETKKLLEFCGCRLNKLESSKFLVVKPSSIGRWRTFNPDIVDKVLSLGTEYLKEFGYS